MRLNDGMPVWHVSVSVWKPTPGLRDPRHGNLRQVSVPNLAEKEAIRELRGVGGDREWWIWNDHARVGHLRLPVTAQEYSEIPCGIAVHDAGPTGIERSRSR
jgi:hypothetical protein